MRPFTPEIYIAAVDDRDAVIIFDSAAAYDRERGVRTLRLARTFQQLSITLEGFDVSPTPEMEDAKEYRAEVHLRAKSADGQEMQHVLAQLRLHLQANRSWGRVREFPPAHEVTERVRQGIAAAFSRALRSYYEKEDHLDTLARTGPEPRGNLAAPETGEPVKTRWAPPWTRTRVLSPSTDSDRRQHRVRMIAAVLGAPALLIVCLMMISPRKHDHIAEAVARSMVQNPASVQEQVDLTARTLKQMGLDPGHSNNVGCLASPPP